MKPVAFTQMNKTWAKDQPQYRELPAYTDEQETISCWRLTLVERLIVLFTGRLWLRQMNFSGPLQPQLPTVRSPWAALDGKGGEYMGDLKLDHTKPYKDEITRLRRKVELGNELAKAAVEHYKSDTHRMAYCSICGEEWHTSVESNHAENCEVLAFESAQKGGGDGS